MKANPNYWGASRRIDRSSSAVQQRATRWSPRSRSGEIDAVAPRAEQRLPRSCARTTGIVDVQGQQGGFDELALNGGAGLKKPHPALLDRRVRVAIAHAIDKKTIVDRVLRGLGTPADTISPSREPGVDAEMPDAERFDFDLAEAKQILDDAGYKDTTATASARCPAAASRCDLRYAVRSSRRSPHRSPSSSPAGSRTSGSRRRRRPTATASSPRSIGKGDYDLFVWGWTPFVDPDPMLSYFTCDQVSQDPKNPTNYYNDANWCDQTYDKLYKQQNVELDPAKRMQIVHQMLTRFYEPATYDVLDYERRPAGLPHRPLHGLDAAAGGDRAGALLEHLADATPTCSRSRRPRRRRRRRVARGRSSRSSSRRSSCSAAPALLVARRRSADERE